MDDKRKILVVDDTPENLKVLGTLLKDEGYEVRVATNGRQALENAKANPPDLILLDVMMPQMSGYEVCHELKLDPNLREIPVIFISALEMEEQKLNAFKEGAVDYVTKPFHDEEVLARVKTNVENKLYRQNLEDLVAQRTHELYLTKEATIASMAILAEYRDNETGGHIQRTKQYVKQLALELQSGGQIKLTDQDIDLIFQSAPLHDIGKVGISDFILHKTGPLTPQEFEEMKQHSAIGAKVIEKTMEILGPNSFLTFAKELTESHHEKWDGSGYPKGLKALEIPLSARLMAIADVYDAIRSPRAYKAPRSHEEAFQIITQGDGRTMPEHFDPLILATFVKIQEKFKAIHNNIVG